MNYNSIPLLITISEALLLILVQQFVRPHLPAYELLALFLGSSPNLILGFCFPFSILMRPRAFTRSVCRRLFNLWSTGTLLLLCLFEVARPFNGAQTFDYLDIIASFAGVILALLFYYFWLEKKLVVG
jgi:hypothetical protein